MEKFKWSEVKEFWEARNSYWENTDHGDDPDALQYVLTIGAPLWYGKRRARIEGIAFRALFDLVPPPRQGARALDIGCGAGRWTRFISEQGYQTVGIDLQLGLLQAARSRYPHIDFLHTSVQEYSTEEPFDLVSSVGVLQYLPDKELQGVIRKIREFVRDGGYVIMLEGIGENEAPPEVFHRSIDDWIELFEQSGFHNIAIRRYYYNSAFKAVNSVRKKVKQLATLPTQRRPSKNELLSPEERSRSLEFKERDLRVYATYLLRGFDPLESILTKRNVALPSDNCGFLFQAI